jgi:TetR/AcrR family transcriptional repressor of nem operon
MRATRVTADRILDIAQRLVQTRGFNAFSYADLSAELGIRKASIHHHFPTKVELGRRLVARYRDGFRAVLEQIDREGPDAPRKLLAYARLYANVLRDEDRMCLCGMLAADFKTLATPIRNAVKEFFDLNEAWLSRVLEEGRKAKRLRFGGPAASQARLLVSGLEGAMLVARTFGDLPRFQEAADRLLSALGVRRRS